MNYYCYMHHTEGGELITHGVRVFCEQTDRHSIEEAALDKLERFGLRVNQFNCRMIDYDVD